MKTAFIKTVLVAATLAASMTIAAAQTVGGPNGGGNSNGGDSNGRLDMSKAPVACPPTHGCRSSTKPRRPRPVELRGECRCDVQELETAGTVSYRKTCYKIDYITNRHQLCNL